jgi:hypothetical protein
VGIWDRDVPVTGAGLMHRQTGSTAPGGVECMTCGAVHPPVCPQKLPPIPGTDPVAVAATSAAVTAAAKDLCASPLSNQLASSFSSPCMQPGSTAAIIDMLHPPQWLPSEISLLHLGSGWLGHGGSVDRLPPPSANFSDPLRTSCACVPPACQLDAPLSWSPLEDERLAVQAARAAEVKAAEDAEAAKRSIDAERRAAAKKRLQLAGAKVAKGMGKDHDPSTPGHQHQDAEQDGTADGTLDDLVAGSFVDQSQVDLSEADQAFADAGGALSVAEVGSFALEGGWYVTFSFPFFNQLLPLISESGIAALLPTACGMAAESCCVTVAVATGVNSWCQVLY